MAQSVRYRKEHKTKMYSLTNIHVTRTQLKKEKKEALPTHTSPPWTLSP